MKRQAAFSIIAFAVFLSAGAEALPPQAFLFTHPSRDSDHNESAKIGARRTVLLAKQHKVPVYYLLGGLSYSSFARHKGQGCQDYLAPQLPDFYVPSNGGEHDLKLAHIHHVVLGGGYVEACLLNTLGHYLRQLAPDILETPRVTYLLDGSYTGFPDRSPVELWRRLFLNPMERREMPDTFDQAETDRFLAWVREKLWNPFKFRERSPLPNWPRSGDFVYQIHLEGRPIGVMGEGPRKIDLDFVRSTRLDELF